MRIGVNAQQFHCFNPRSFSIEKVQRGLVRLWKVFLRCFSCGLQSMSPISVVQTRRCRVKNRFPSFGGHNESVSHVMRCMDEFRNAIIVDTAWDLLKWILETGVDPSITLANKNIYIIGGLVLINPIYLNHHHILISWPSWVELFSWTKNINDVLDLGSVFCWDQGI